MHCRIEGYAELLGLDTAQYHSAGLDVVVPETYIVEHLGGVIPASRYGDPAGDGRVTMK